MRIVKEYAQSVPFSCNFGVIRVIRVIIESL